MNLKAIIAVVVAAVVVAGSAVAISITDLFDAAEDNALELVPADAAIYVNVFLDPSTSQKLALDELLAHFPQASNRDAAHQRIVELIDRGLAEVGLTFAADIEPWLGDQIAFFMQTPTDLATEPALGLLIETDDADAARSAIDKAQANDLDTSFESKTYRDVTYDVSTDGDAVGIVESFVVSGSERGIIAVIDASRGDSLESSEEFRRATQRLEADRLAFAYADLSGLAQLPAAGLGAPLAGPFNPANQGPGAGIVYARADGLVFEASSEMPSDESAAAFVRGAARESRMFRRLPGDAWLAVGVPRFGATMRQVLRTFEDAFGQTPTQGIPGLNPGAFLEGLEMQIGLDIERDLLSWMGDGGLFVDGVDPTSLGGGLVIEASDRKAAGAALARIERSLRRLGAPLRPARGGSVGFAIQERGMPQPINVVLAGDRVVAIYGNPATDRALRSGATLGESETFRRGQAAVGDDYALSALVDIPKIVELANAFGLSSAEYGREVVGWLDPLSFIAAGARVDDDVVLQRVVIGVR